MACNEGVGLSEGDSLARRILVYELVAVAAVVEVESGTSTLTKRFAASVVSSSDGVAPRQSGLANGSKEASPLRLRFVPFKNTEQRSRVSSWLKS